MWETTACLGSCLSSFFQTLLNLLLSAVPLSGFRSSMSVSELHSWPLPADWLNSWSTERSLQCNWKGCQGRSWVRTVATHNKALNIRGFLLSVSLSKDRPSLSIPLDEFYRTLHSIYRFKTDDESSQPVGNPCDPTYSSYAVIFVIENIACYLTFIIVDQDYTLWWIFIYLFIYQE